MQTFELPADEVPHVTHMAQQLLDAYVAGQFADPLELIRTAIVSGAISHAVGGLHIGVSEAIAPVVLN